MQKKRECSKRHPVICRHKDDCKFIKANNCAFKHKEIESEFVGNDLENKLDLFAKEIESLNRNRKDDIFIQRRLYNDEEHAVVDIFH